MGSNGVGRFTDYSKRKSSDASHKDGGSSGLDICKKAISTELEEIGRCFYYTNYGSVPEIGTKVIVFFNKVRISVENELGEEIGYLPTEYNYLISCMEIFSYEGIVQSSSLEPLPKVIVDIIHSEK